MHDWHSHLTHSEMSLEEQQRSDQTSASQKILKKFIYVINKDYHWTVVTGLS